MGRVVSLYQETTLMSDLKTDSLELIRHTEAIAAIKRLIIAYEILDLNIRIERDYAEFNGHPPWDVSAMKDLDLIRFELMTSFSNDFDPSFLLPKYYKKMGSLFSLMNLKVTLSS